MSLCYDMDMLLHWLNDASFGAVPSSNAQRLYFFFFYFDLLNSFVDALKRSRFLSLNNNVSFIKMHFIWISLEITFNLEIFHSFNEVFFISSTLLNFFFFKVLNLNWFFWCTKYRDLNAFLWVLLVKIKESLSSVSLEFWAIN